MRYSVNGIVLSQCRQTTVYIYRRERLLCLSLLYIKKFYAVLTALDTEDRFLLSGFLRILRVFISIFEYVMSKFRQEASVFCCSRIPKKQQEVHEFAADQYADCRFDVCRRSRRRRGGCRVRRIQGRHCASQKRSGSRHRFCRGGSGPHPQGSCPRSRAKKKRSAFGSKGRNSSLSQRGGAGTQGSPR